MASDNPQVSGESNRPKAGAIPLPKSKRGIKGFWTEMIREMKKVHWPAPKETHRLTGVVMAVCALVVVIVGGLSFAFGTIVNLITKGSIN
jgi:preprotein translocase SecE subunit